MRNPAFRFNSLIASTLGIALVVLLAASNLSTSLASGARGVEPRLVDGVKEAASLFPGCIQTRVDGAIACRQATVFEAAAFRRGSDAALDVHPIPRTGLQGADGLTIELRGTDQLEDYPEAKAAYQRAAEAWESAVRTRIHVIIDVDFGPTWFGQEFGEGDVGFTHPQMLIGEGIYQPVLQSLVATASNKKQYDFYVDLPDWVVPTDMGETSSVMAPSALFRAIRIVNPDATFDPPQYGPQPAIGFNSNLEFDFDPSDGIDEGKYDFDAMVCHEMGHVLGFVSLVGLVEMDEEAPLALSIWDLFRFRPGITFEGIGTVQRVLSSGGEQVFFDGDEQLGLSTARPDGTGGDGSQASHWKGLLLTGERIGVMDPTLPIGLRSSVTVNDLAALDLLGHHVRPNTNATPVITSLFGDLNGDVLTMNGSLVDVDGDVVSGQTRLYDAKGKIVGETAPFPFEYGITPSINFTLKFPDMSRSPQVIQMGLTLIDSLGNRSKEVKVDFSGGDAGGPKLAKANYKNAAGALILKGNRFKAVIEVEVNGVKVDPAGIKIKNAGQKLKITGLPGDLNLRSGPNRFRVISNGLRSNIVVKDL